MGCIQCSDTLACSEHHDEQPVSNTLSQGQLESTLEPESPSSNSSSGSSNTLDNPIKKESVYNLENRTLDNRVILSFPHGDPENPVNWSSRKKVFILAIGIVAVVNSTFGSSLPSGAMSSISSYFNVADQAESVLPISLFLVGYVLGPLAFGPLSESYGRRIVMVSSFVVFTIFTMACAVAPNWPAFLVFRLLSGICASSAIAVVGGLFADVYDDPTTRGRAMAVFMAATTCGPTLAPIMSGFVTPRLGWRWTFWVGLIVAGASLAFLSFLPETYGPEILRQRARKMRKEKGNPKIFAPLELEKKGAKQMVTVTLMRPLNMIFTEAIVGFTCIYVSLAYAIFCMIAVNPLGNLWLTLSDLFFEAYPLIFEGIYDMNTGEAGLAFLAIAVGSFFALAIFLYYDGFLQRAKNRGAHWTTVEEYRRLPLACLGGPLYVVSLFWLGWSASVQVHWIVPVLAGVPFGIGFMLIFMALLNYVADAYEIFSASGMSATSCCRSVFGAILPLAARPMYRRLGIPWASSLLGFLSLGLSVMPFIFIKYGHRIRANSKFCQELKARKVQAGRGLKNQTMADCHPTISG